MNLSRELGKFYEISRRNADTALIFLVFQMGHHQTEQHVLPGACECRSTTGSVRCAARERRRGVQATSVGVQAVAEQEQGQKDLTTVGVTVVCFQRCAILA